MPGQASFPLSKTLEPEDYKVLAPELGLVDQFNPVAKQASDHRRWEYAMALRAISEWQKVATVRARMAATVFDVGGAGSALPSILASLALLPFVIDPDYNYPLQRILYKKPKMQASVVTCISVLEHVKLEEFDEFLLALGSAILPGGLLFLTCDYTEDGTVDTQHFHWDRRQIFDEKKLTDVANQLYAQSNLTIFGAIDRVYHGPQIYPSYTFASLCMIKQEASR